jgi:hypothetical protein
MNDLLPFPIGSSFSANTLWSGNFKSQHRLRNAGRSFKNAPMRQEP